MRMLRTEHQDTGQKFKHRSKTIAKNVTVTIGKPMESKPDNEPKAKKNVVDSWVDRQIAKASNEFYEALENFQRLRGGGMDSDKEKPPLRRSPRFQPKPDQEQVKTILAPTRQRRKAEKPLSPVQKLMAQVPPPQKKTIRFTKTVQVELYEMLEASPRREPGGKMRRRVQMGNKLDVKAPPEMKRLKRPTCNQDEPPQLTTAQREDILGPATPELSPQREQELVKDPGCRSTCAITGCQIDTCLCIINGVPCEDNHCGCEEEVCPNGREDMSAEDPSLFNMRLDIANYDLENESAGPEQSTIASVDNERPPQMEPEEAEIVDEEEVEEEKEEEEEADAENVQEDMEAEDGSDSDGSNNDSNNDDAAPQPLAGRLPDFGLDLSPKHFPSNLLQLMPIQIDADCRNSCLEDEWLDSGAIFVGFLKEATRFNERNIGTEQQCAVLHPEAFSQAMILAERDEEAEKRRKAAGSRNPVNPQPLNPAVVSQLVVYGDGWSHMIIPCHLLGNHWATVVVTRASASAVIFDSSPELKTRPKMYSARIKVALQKILVAAQCNNANDTLTGRYKIRMARSDRQDTQIDTHSCGVFSIVHARRVLERGNGNACTRQKKGDPDVNIVAERRSLRVTIMELIEFYEMLAEQNLILDHSLTPRLPFAPAAGTTAIRKSTRH